MVIHDESGTPLAGEVCPNPLQEDGQTETRRRQELQVYACPCEPCSEPLHSDLVTLQNGKALANYRHVAFVEVTEWTGRRRTGYAVVNDSSCITSLLHRDLRDAGKRLAVFLE